MRALVAAAVATLSFATAASAQIQGEERSYVRIEANEFGCGVQDVGYFCEGTNTSAGQNVPGGEWPAGSGNQYLFDWWTIAGARIEANGNHPWAGDTVNVSFAGFSGSQAVGLTRIWNSADPSDLVQWPGAGAYAAFPGLSAYVNDPTVFDEALLGRKTASQQDTWQAWLDTGRVGLPATKYAPPVSPSHPSGMLVDVRTLAWAYPAGNEATVYFVFRFTNVSADPNYQDIFRRHLEPGEILPPGGWTLRDVYFAPYVDADLDRASSNYEDVVVPFALGVTYDDDFDSDDYRFDPWLFRSPFLERSPGMVGVQVVESPAPEGLTANGLFAFAALSNGGFNDPGSYQIWRYLSMNVDPYRGDSPCTFADPKRRHVCYIPSVALDSRYFMSTGPFTLDPGESKTVIVAAMAAAVVDVPGINPGSYYNAPPLTPTEPSPHPGCFGHQITPIERAAGWVETTACPSAEWDALDIDDVRTVPESLLRKAQVAHVLAENGFLLPQPPAAPTFTLEPAPDGITVRWQPSPSTGRDEPYARLAGDSMSALYDPNFRSRDVEGYRIYRSLDGEHWSLVAQFDSAGTSLVDYRCATDADHATGESCGDTTVVPLTGRVVQYTRVARTRSGATIVLRADSATSSEFPPLADTGIPYEYTDTTTRMGFDYFYRVTAFDVNSVASGPASMESEGDVQFAVPQATNVAVSDLSKIRVAPDPYYGAGGFDLGPSYRRLRFFNLPPKASIRIYTVSGTLVDVINHDAANGESVATWDLTNLTDLRVASGVYFYHVSTPEGREYIGRFTVINQVW